ncbi:cupin domain-containing protein [Paraburkholderia sp. C35]|uniref:cupin domain-containing protein n=1 Tax=Paraburkholderia sp. C35 TaxID=2126993 RepID=UPI0013A53EEC|nr:cupin domain-containing protein [Paraburkholderia sp. C35]
MFVLNDKPVEYDFGGSRTRLLVSGDQTGNAYCMLELFSPAGRASPMHRHQHEDETLHMLDGELEVIVDGAPQCLRPGSMLVLPRGTEHQIINRTGQTAHYLVICTPAGFERFVDTCADAQTGPVEARIPTDADKVRMRDAATQFGITLLPPRTAS